MKTNIKEEVGFAETFGENNIFKHQDGLYSGGDPGSFDPRAASFRVPKSEKPIV